MNEITEKLIIELERENKILREIIINYLISQNNKKSVIG